MFGYNVREGKAGEYKAFLQSKKYEDLCVDVKAKSGLTCLETYFTIIPSPSEQGDYDAYDMWEAPNWAAFDKGRETNAFGKLFEAAYEFIEPRPYKWVALRKANEVQIIYEPKK
jgi:hypothetical protein